MLWDCERQGCFNKKKRPKIEVFAGCLPGKISFGDVDAIVEVGGHFLMMEWKPSMNPLSMGQSIMYERLTQQKNWSVIIVAGDAETMQIDGMASYVHQDGGSVFIDWEDCTLDELKSRIERWAIWVKNPRAFG